MPEVAAIGDKLSISIFKSQDVDIYPVDELDVVSLFKSVYSDYKIIFVTEEVYELCSNLIEFGKVVPVVVVLPSVKSRKKIAYDIYRKISITATGSELI